MQLVIKHCPILLVMVIRHWLETLIVCTEGSENTAVVDGAGLSVTAGHNLTLMGTYAQPSSPYTINEITLGNKIVATIRCQFNPSLHYPMCVIKRI